MSQLTVEVRAAGGTGEGQMGVQPLVDKIVTDRAASALATQHPTRWGPRAQPEAARRLAWVALPETSRPLRATIEALRAELRSDGIDRVIPAGMGGSPTPAFVDGEVAVHPVGDWLPAGVSTLSDALWALVTVTPPRGYLAVQAYLDRVADASAAVLRTELARRTQLQTTFGWGPRFLHSTGQYYKGGHQNGAFLQLTGALERDIPVPRTGFTLGELQQAQALGDAQVLTAHGRPVLRLHLLDRAAGLVALVHALQEHR
jgi:hypothetical protein